MARRSDGNGPQRPRETADMEAFVKRVLRSIAARAEDGDMDVVESLERIRIQAEQMQARAVSQLRAGHHHYSWADVGEALGITRQAAQQRFGNGSGGEEV